MGDLSFVEPLVSRKDQPQEDDHGKAWSPDPMVHGGQASQLIQSILVFVPRAFDAQQCFITTFTDSSSYPSNILSDWSLQDASPLLTSLPSTAFFLGSFAAGFLLTPLADSRLGRKSLLLLSCLLMSLSGLLTVFSPNIFVYSALRFASGFGRASIGACTLVLSTELVVPRWRPYVGLLSFVLFSFGFASLPAIAYLSRHSSWRHVYLWTSLPALLYCVVIYWLVKESPRWMRLETITGTYSAMRALVSRKWLRRRLALVMGITFGFGVAYYGMPLGIGSLSFNLYLSVAMEALIELPSALAAFCLIGTVNRKSSLLVTTTVSGVCSIACGVMSWYDWAHLALALELTAFLVGCIACDIGMIYASELFPTCVRNSAVAMAYQTVMLGGGVGALLASVGESLENELITYGGFGAVIMVCGVFVVWLPETRGTEPCDTMEEEEWKHSKGLGLVVSSNCVHA